MRPSDARKKCCGIRLWCTEGKRVLGGVLREAQSDPKRGSETMSATVREARMIEQPGRPLHPHFVGSLRPAKPGGEFAARAQTFLEHLSERAAEGELFRHAEVYYCL